MPGRHMQIDGSALIVVVWPLGNNHRLCIDNWRRRRIANVYFPIDTWTNFAFDREVDNRVFRMGRQTAQQEGCKCNCL
jgi:hypothetical protein